MWFNRFTYTAWVCKLGLWNGKRLASKWSKFPFKQQVGIKLAAWGCHRPELDVQPRPAVECWEVLSVPLTRSGCCFLLILPLAPPAGTALNPRICHVSALPHKDPGDFVVCELLPIFPPPGVFIIYVTSGQLQMCCPSEHMDYVCLKGMTFAHLWYAEYYLQKVSCTAALIQYSQIPAGFVVFADAFRVQASAADVLWLWRSEQCVLPAI